jgi:cbb3-type cytochrome oxidase maturation protein
MNVIYLLLPLALLLAFVFVAFYLWAAKHDQFEDLDTPPKRILLDDNPPRKSSS